MTISRKKFLSQSLTVLFLLPLSNLLKSCSWKKRNPADPEPMDTSSAVQNLPVLSKIIVLTPLGGEVFKAGEEVEIKWSQTELNFVDLYFSPDGGDSWNKIESNVAASSAVYTWLVPPIAASRYLIRISETGNPTIHGQSSGYFRVKIIFPIELSVYPSLQSAGGFQTVELPSKGSSIIIRKPADEFQVMSLYCTHNGCLISYNGSTEFNCSCHGSKFTPEGEVLQGPAQKPLNEYEYLYVQEDNRLFIII